MAVEGDLEDIEITSMIQLLCTERRTTGLVVRRRGEEGVLYFENGEIIHAFLGPLEGEEAVYSMLAWKEGTFRITDKLRAQTRSITTGWRHMLMEGMRQLDEGHRSLSSLASLRQLAPEEEAWNADEIDAALEAQMIGLLSQLEQSLARLNEDRIQRRPTQALELVGGMVDRTAKQGAELSTSFDRPHRLDTVLKDVSERTPEARLLVVEGERLSLARALSVYRSWSADSRERQRTFRAVLRSMVQVLETFFELAAHDFQSTSTAAGWRESYRVFVRDLTAAIDRLPL